MLLVDDNLVVVVWVLLRVDRECCGLREAAGCLAVVALSGMPAVKCVLDVLTHVLVILLQDLRVVYILRSLGLGYHSLSIIGFGSLLVDWPFVFFPNRSLSTDSVGHSLDELNIKSNI